MPDPEWVFIVDDDDRQELWQNQATGEEQWIEREGTPLHEVPADEIKGEPLYGPPE